MPPRKDRSTDDERIVGRAVAAHGLTVAPWDAVAAMRRRACRDAAGKREREHFVHRLHRMEREPLRALRREAPRRRARCRAG